MAIPMHEYVEKMHKIYHSEWRRISIENDFVIHGNFWNRLKILFFKKYRNYKLTFTVYVKCEGPFMIHNPTVEYQLTNKKKV